MKHCSVREAKTLWHARHIIMVVVGESIPDLNKDILKLLKSKETGAFVYRNGLNYRNGLPEWTFICGF